MAEPQTVGSIGGPYRCTIGGPYRWALSVRYRWPLSVASYRCSSLPKSSYCIELHVFRSVSDAVRQRVELHVFCSVSDTGASRNRRIARILWCFGHRYQVNSSDCVYFVVFRAPDAVASPSRRIASILSPIGDPSAHRVSVASPTRRKTRVL